MHANIKLALLSTKSKEVQNGRIKGTNLYHNILVDLEQESKLYV